MVRLYHDPLYDPDPERIEEARRKKVITIRVSGTGGKEIRVVQEDE